MTEQRIRVYSEFWDFYVSEHSRPMTRNLHLTGTFLGLILLVWFLLSKQFILIPLCLVVGYGFAWFSHFFVEKNRPATFRYPLWSFVSDYRMMWYMITGRMGNEVARVTVSGGERKLSE